MVHAAPTRGRRFRLRPPRRAVAGVLAVSLLQPIAALTVPWHSTAAADPGGCLALDDAGDRLLTVDTAGNVASGAALSGGNYGGLAWRPDGMLLATRTGTVGTIDPAGGDFTTRYDVLAGADTGQLTGVAVDPRTLETYVVAANGKLRQLDPWTGAPVAAAVQLTLPTGSTGVGDVAMLPSGRLLFVAGHADGDVLFTTDRSGSGTELIGPVLLPADSGIPTPVTGVHGLSLDASGRLFVSTDGTGPPAGTVLAVDLATGTAALHATAPGSSMVGLVCARPAGIHVTGTVFVDDDRDATWDQGVEPVETAMTVTLASSGTTLQTATTDAAGAYSFWTSETSALTATAAVPAGAGVTTDATVPSTGGRVDIGYRFASVGGTVFDDLDGDAVRDTAEPVLPGIEVTVRVTDAGGATVEGTARTDATGAYLVDDLPAGDASVTVPAADPAGPVAGSPTPPALTFVLDGAAHRGGSDLGYDGRATVSGEVWNDLNGDARRDADEPDLGGITVRLRDRADATVEVTAVSAGDGSYTILMPPGDVTLDVDPASLAPGASATNGPFQLSLARAEAETAPDLGVQSLAVIGGRVFNDIDSDGTDDAGTDAGFAGTPVRLLQNGTEVRATRTDTAGGFRFTDLRAGTYTVAVDTTDAGDDLPTGLGSTTGGDTRSATIATEGEISEGWTFGYAGATTITGVVFDDLDGGGTYEPAAGDTPLDGVAVTVDGAASVTTGADGVYSFAGLAHGDHQLAVDPSTLPPGATVLTDLSGPVTTTAGATTRKDVAVDIRGAIGDLVFNDLDRDGSHSEGEPGLAGVRLTAVPQDGGTSGITATTGSDGRYLLDGLEPGRYVVVVDATTLPPGVGGETTPTAVRDVTIGVGQTVDTVDIGYDGAATIGGRLWDDVDHDGLEGTDEPGLGGIRLDAVDADGLVAATTTSSTTDGRFLLDGLAPGTYTVVVDETALPGYVRSTPQPVVVPVAVGEDGDAGDIGYWRPASITLTLFDDLDGDGVDGPDEPVGPDVDGRTVTLVLDADGNGTADPEEVLGAVSGSTDASGVVVFGELVPGDYLVDTEVPDGYAVTTGNDPAAVAVAPGDAAAVGVGIQAHAPLVTVTTGVPDSLSGEAGDELSYPFRVENDGNVRDRYDLTSTSDPAATVRIVRAGDPAGAAITSTGGLAPGEGVDLVAVVTVPGGLPRGSVVATTVTVTGTTKALDGHVASGQATVRSTVVMPALAVEVEGGAPGEGYVSPGATVPYTVAVTNGTAGDRTVADAREVVVEVAIAPADAGAVVAGSVTVNGETSADQTFPLTLDAVPAGARLTVAFELELAHPLADGTVVTVTGTATATGNPEGEPRSSTDATSDTVSSSALPETVLGAAPPAGDLVEPGETLTYTAVVGNAADATDTWRGVVLVGDLPGTVTVTAVTVDGTVAAPADLATDAGVAVGDLPPGEHVTIVVEVEVHDPIVDASVITAVLRADGSNGGPVVWAVSHTVDARLGVAVGPDRDGQGEASTAVAHPHELRNTGNVTTVFDLMSSTDLGWPTTVVLDANANGVVDAGEETITVTPPVPGGGGAPVHLLSVVEVPPGEPDGTTATTTLAAFSQVEPPAIAQAFAVTETVAPELVVDIAASPSSTVVGRDQTVTYTTTVRNDGRATATGVTLTDPTPDDATYVRGSATVDGAPVPDGPAGANPFAAGWPVGDLAAGTARAVSFQVVVGAVADGTPLIHQATVTADDDRGTAGSLTQTVSASPVLDVALSSTPAPGSTVTAGSQITYTAVVANDGTLSATGVTLQQAVPDRTAYVPGSTTVDGATVADVGGTGPTVGGLDLGTLAPGASRTVRFLVRVADPVFDGEELVAVATVTSQQGVSAASVALRSVVDVRPAISLTGGGTQDVARPGQAVYAHTVRNAGDVTDTFTIQARSGLGWRVSLVRDDDGDGRWDPTREITPVTATGPLAPGSSLRFLVVVEVDADAALGTADTTTVTARSVVDPAVTATTTSRTSATAPSLELSLSATPSGDRVNPGSPITYLISVRNRGAAPATDVVVTSATPTATVYVPDSAQVDGGAVPDGTAGDGNPVEASNGGVRIPSIAAGGEMLVTFTVDVPATARVGQVVAATATATATATAPVTASRTHTVAAGATLDLVLTADPAPDTATPAGTRITYTVTVRNTGQQPAGDVHVVADTPRDTSYAPGSTRIDGVPVTDGRTDPNPLSSVHGGLGIGDLAPDGDAVTITYAVTVDDPVPADAEVVHRASALAGDVTATSEELVHSVAVAPGAAVTPDVDANAVPGGFADLAHTVTNTGDVTDAFALTAISTAGWVTSIHTDRDGDGDLEADDVEVGSTPVLAPGEGTTIVVRVAVPTAAPIGAEDVVRVTAASSLSPDVSGSARDTIAVVTGALRLVKTAAPLSLTPGARSTYTLTVRNVGTAPATGVVLTDGPPEGTRYVVGSTRRDGAAVADAEGTTALAGGLSLGDLLPVGSTTVTFAVETLDVAGLTSIVNSATVTAADAATTTAGTVQPVSRQHGLDLTTAPDVTVAPGSTVSRPHVLANTGIAPDDVAVTGSSALGLPVTLHVDRDGDGTLDDTDPVVATPIALEPAERIRLLAVVHYTADVPEGARDEVVVTARSGGEPGVVVSVTDVIVVSAADVTVTLSASPAGDVAPGDLVTYEAVVTNRALTAAGSVVVAIETPAGTAYVPGSATLDGAALSDAGGDDPSPLSGANGGVDLGTLAAGTTVVLGFVVAVGDAEVGDTIAAVAGVRIDGGEPAYSNTTRAVVVDTAGLQVLKSATPTAVSGVGEVVTWTITVMNLGTGDAQDVVLSDPPAAGTRYLPGSTSVDGRTVGDGLIAPEGLALGDLPAGGTRVVVFRTVLDVPGAVVQNVAGVRSAGSQVQPLSNVAAVTVGGILPATGAAGTRTLGGAAVLLVSGWMLLYLARPERAPVPVLRGLAGRRTIATRRRRPPSDDPGADPDRRRGGHGG